jgi:hypothetical protein
MMSPENVTKMALLDKGQPVKRPAAAYGVAFSGAAALGKPAASVFGEPAHPKRVSVRVPPVNVGLLEKGDATDDHKSEDSSGRSTPSRSQEGHPQAMEAMMGVMERMASQIATLGQAMEGLKAPAKLAASPPPESGPQAVESFKAQLASILGESGQQGGVANLTSAPDIADMLKKASRAKGVTTTDSVSAAMLQRTQGVTETQIRSHIKENKITARSQAEMVALAMAIDAFKEGRQDDGLEILHRRMIGVFYSDTRSNWSIMEALLPTSGQLLETSDLAKILVDAKRLSAVKGDKDKNKTPNGKQRNRFNRFGSSPFYGGRHPGDGRNGWTGQGFQGPPPPNGFQGPPQGYFQPRGGFGGHQGGFNGAPRGRGRGRF